MYRAPTDGAQWGVGCAAVATPLVSRMCGKQRTLSLMILDVWQRKGLAGEFAHVWQGKDLGEVKVEKGD
jgi:hypothetical protein